MTEWIIFFSVFVQLVAAFMALRFFEGIPAKKGWLFISIAVSLMVLRRFFGLLRTTGEGQNLPLETIGLIEETIGFATSCFLLYGLYHLGSLFKFVQESGEKIISSEKKYRSVFHGASDAIFVVSRDGTILDCNESAEKLLGVSSEDLIGAKLSRFILFPDIETLRETISPNRINEVCWIISTSDGRKIEAELRASRVMIDGEENILCVFRDRTEEKRMQQELQKSYEYFELLFDKNPVPIFTLDESGRVVLWNFACEKLTGIPKDAIIGKKPNFESIYPNRKVPPTLAELLLVFDASSLAKKFEKQGVSLYLGMPDAVTCETVFEVHGRKKIVKLIASRIYSPNEELIGVIQIAQDITTERALERYAFQAQRMEALGRLASGIAHDFRNILMVVQSGMEFLKYKFQDNPEVRRYSREVGIAIDQGVSLCRQLMGFAVEERSEQLMPQAYNVNNIIRSLEKFVRRVFRENIHVQVELDPNISNVKAYPGQIDRVLINLFLNAQDAMPSGGTLLVRTKEVNVSREEIPPGIENVSPGPFVVIMVKDTGIGMDEVTLEKIFEPFFSGKKEMGHGLGLYVVWNEIRNLGGFIKVESSLSLGTVFYCYLPVWKEGIEDRDLEESEDTIEVTTPKRILLVEDNLALKDIMANALQALGHLVYVAGSIREALYLLDKEGEFLDVAICDFRLTDGSGYTVVEEIQSRFPHIKPVLMTGYAEKEVVDKCRRDGIPVLSKPFSMGKLQRIIVSMEDPSLISASYNRNTNREKIS
ncbi:MAG: PAS domain S-box protein [Syntrophobacterales bacterium]|nr:PAS domain S-box protein [Syntrophobacterales bacterium]